jgi:hypothetical protein
LHLVGPTERFDGGVIKVDKTTPGIFRMII